MPTALRSLRSRNFRLYFAGQLVSLAGTWMQQVAMGWLVYRLSGSALVLGILGFASQVPILAFGFLGGVWSDRFDRRRTLLWTQSLAMIQALLLTALVWVGRVTPTLLVFLAFVLGCINAMDIPARQSFAVQLVDDKDDLPNAIALNSFLMNAGRFVGPALAGFAVALFGEVACFFLNAVSYLAVLLALRAIHTQARGGNGRFAVAEALWEGLRYTFGHRDIRACLFLVAGISFFVSPYAVLMPMFTREIFGGDARIFGLLMGAIGAGSLLASVYLAQRSATDGLHRKVCAAAPTVGLALAVFAVNRQLWLAFPILMLLGFTTILIAAGSNTLIQTWVHDDFRGRVMATFSIAFVGVAPLGSFTVGASAHVFGLRPTLLFCGVLSMLGGLTYRRFMKIEIHDHRSEAGGS